MRLLDQIAQAREAVMFTHPSLGRVELPGANRFGPLIREAETRFVLAADLARTCSGIIRDQPELLADCVDIIRLPARRLWLEWSIEDLIDQPATARAFQRAGIIVESDEAGRAGTIQSFWESEWGPDASPAMLYFDLDKAQDQARSDTAEPLKGILSHTEMKFHSEWESFYRAAIPDPIEFNKLAHDTLSTALKDVLLLLAFSLVCSMRSELAIVPSALTKLNKARSKRGAPSLLDFTEVGTTLLAQRARGDAGGATAGSRTSARLHHVRGHFVRRADRIFWRRPHLRGDVALGPAPARITRLSLQQINSSG